MSEIKVGDVVELKSGSPKMTVKELVNSNTCDCVWYENGTWKSELIFAGILRKIA